MSPSHHSVFAHQVLRQLVLEETRSFFLAAARQDLRPRLETVWDLVGEQIPPADRMPSAGLEVAVCELATHPLLDVVLVRMPPPRLPPEAHLIAVVRGEKLRYFTLEMSLSLSLFGSARPDAAGDEEPLFGTMLCEWDEQGHLNHGPGPDPVIADFLAAIGRQLGATTTGGG